MTKEFKRLVSVLLLLLGIIVYSLGAFAYLYDNFVSKDTFQMIVDDIKYIRDRVDKLD